jgi:hypothetical protein
MRVRDQLVGATVLGIATWFGILRIAEAKNEAAVGSATYPVDERHGPELAAFTQVLADLRAMNQDPLAARLDDLHRDRRIWAAPHLGSQRWAVFVETMSLVRRIYIRRTALLDPRAHLYPTPRPDIPARHQLAFAKVSLGGALRHELAHYDGALDELTAYRQELEWYAALRGAPFFAALAGEERPAWEWAIEAAILSAEAAAARAGPG